MVVRPPIQLIGKFGEYFAAKWLEEKEYEIKGYSDLRLALDPGLRDDLPPPLPEEEYRRRRIESLAGRIPHLEANIREIEKSPEAHRHKRWITNHKQKAELMKKALEDLRAGKPISEITDPEGERTYRDPYRVYQEQEVEEVEAKQFLVGKTKDFQKYDEECEALSREERSPEAAVLPDIVAKKGREYLFVEVKANDATQTELQRKAFLLASKYGFKTMLLRVKIEAHCAEEPAPG